MSKQESEIESDFLKEKEYNSVDYYVDRLFKDGLLVSPEFSNPVKVDDRKYLYYFIDMPNLFNSDQNYKGVGDDRMNLLRPEQEYGDIFSSFIIDTLIYLLFDYMWEPSDQREKKQKITLYQKIIQDPTNFYMGLNFFTKRSNNPYRNEFCFKTSESSRVKNPGDLDKIDLLPDLVDYIKYSNNNNDRIEQLSSLLSNGDKLKVDATINYSNIYCCNEYSLRDNFKYTLRSNSETNELGNNDGFLDESSQSIKFTDTENINLNCSKVSIVDEEDNNGSQNLKLPRNLPIDPELVKFYNELQKFSYVGGYNFTGPLHSLNSYDDINLLKWYTYFYHYFYVDKSRKIKGKNVYLSIISNDKFRWAGNGSVTISSTSSPLNNNDPFTETEFFFKKTNPKNFKEVKEFILSIAKKNKLDIDKYDVDFKNEDDLYNEKNKPTVYRSSSDFVAYCVNEAQTSQESWFLREKLSGLPFMERSVGFEIIPSTLISSTGKTGSIQQPIATGVNDNFSSKNFYKKKGGAPIQNLSYGIKLSVKQRIVQGRKILTSTHVNFLPLINDSIREVEYGYNECNYSETNPNWLI